MHLLAHMGIQHQSTSEAALHDAVTVFLVVASVAVVAGLYVMYRRVLAKQPIKSDREEER